MSPLRDRLGQNRNEQRGTAKRIACLLVPDLPLRAELRAHPELAELPFVVATGPDGRAQVIEVSHAARRAGVRPRGSVTHARAIFASRH